MEDNPQKGTSLADAFKRGGISRKIKAKPKSPKKRNAKSKTKEELVQMRKEMMKKRPKRKTESDKNEKKVLAWEN